MKSIRLIALSAILTIGTFSAIVYTSCHKDACKDTTCLHGGTCTGGTCKCPAGYTGASCQTCPPGYTGASCEPCPPGYTGTSCQVRAFIGTWSGSDACTPSASYNVVITLANSSTDTTKVVITNPGGFGTNDSVTGTLSTDARTIVYNQQIVTSTAGTITYHDTISGTILLSDNTHFTHDYTDKRGVIHTCIGHYTKQ